MQELDPEIRLDNLQIKESTGALAVAPGRGLQAAYNILRATARPYARQIVVIVMSGLEHDCNPYSITMANVMKEARMLVCAIGGRPTTPEGAQLTGIAQSIDCDTTNQVPANTPDELVQAIASPGLSFLAENVGDISTILAQLPASTCGNFDGTGMPVVIPDDNPPAEVVCRPESGYGIDEDKYLFSSAYGCGIGQGTDPGGGVENGGLSGEQLSTALCTFWNEFYVFIQESTAKGDRVFVNGSLYWWGGNWYGQGYLEIRNKTDCSPIANEDHNDTKYDGAVGGVNFAQHLTIPICYYKRTEPLP
jgi:hypothetical protein